MKASSLIAKFRLPALASGLAASSQALAGVGGLTKVNTTMTAIQTTLTTVGVVILTIAIIWAGFKMLFQNSRFTDVAGIVFGGILIGGAAAIAAWLATPG